MRTEECNMLVRRASEEFCTINLTNYTMQQEVREFVAKEVNRIVEKLENLIADGWEGGDIIFEGSKPDSPQFVTIQR